MSIEVSSSEIDATPVGDIDASSTAKLIGYRLRRAQLSVFQRFIAIFDDVQLRPAEYSMLVLIADNPGRKQTEIAEILGIKQANFVALVQDFEGRGLIERRPAADDRRAKALHLNAAGQIFLKTVRQRHEVLEAELVAALGGEDARDTFLAMLDRIA